MSKLAPPKLPYNDPSNLRSDGNPKWSENSWEILEEIKAGDHVWLDDFINWPEKTPTNVWEALAELRKEVRRLKEELNKSKQIDFVKVPKEEKLEDFVKYAPNAESYSPSDILDWPGGITSKNQALDSLAEHKVTKQLQVATSNVAVAEASYSQAQMDAVIALLNELKAKINDMNS